MQAIYKLVPQQFDKTDRSLLEFGPLEAHGFRFASGICAVQLSNEHGKAVVLPFQGQQIWSVSFNDRELTMRSMFDQPRPTRHFLESFGGFLQHCGATAAGGPGPEDTHPLHGELPLAPYSSAYLVTGEDDRGPYIGVGGCYQHTVAFAHNYTAEPLVLLHADRTRLDVSMTITNRKQSAMELLYLTHVNFRAIDGGRIVYSARAEPDSVQVRTSIPDHIQPGPDYRQFLKQLEDDPSRHEILESGLPFDPEVVFFIDYEADEEGWAHSMQIHPDGSADYIAHRPRQLPKATRWISRTPDQDAIALVEPGTCEPEGYTAEKAKGNVKLLNAGEVFQCELDVGYLGPEQTRQLVERIRHSSAARIRESVYQDDKGGKAPGRPD